jgi:glycogen debranching enzyme
VGGAGPAYDADVPDAIWGAPAREIDVPSAIGGPGGVTLVEGSAFCISRAGGDISPGSTQGLYYHDTRFLSRFELLLDGEPPLHLAFHGLSPDQGTFLGMIVRGTSAPRVLVERQRKVGAGMRELIVLRNMEKRSTTFHLELFFDGDFADLYEVKEARIRKEGYLGAGPRDGGLFFGYQREDFRRGLEIRFDPLPRLAQREASFDVEMGGGESWMVAVELRPVMGRTVMRPHERKDEADTLSLEMWRAHRPRFNCSVPSWDLAARQAVDDLGSLRIPDPENPEHAVFAAGMPWFMTLFGRDSIIAAWQALLLDTSAALTTAAVLARHQGISDNTLTSEEPGKILHEMRFGERSDPTLGGAHVYYGTVDATPLFVLLVRELLRFGAREQDVRRLMPAVEEALQWIKRWGDFDDDGFVEYPTDRASFLWNQGWKDSFDGVSHPDGRIAEGPIALCEVQGYVYAAYLAGAELREHLGRGDPGELREAAARLARAFDDAFFMPDEAFCALALDGHKEQVAAISSNPGHLLWSGILPADRAALVARRLLDEDLFSGFGIRTLSSTMKAYNPLSYHNGTVWPHDNGIAISGMLRYGLIGEATKATAGLLVAAPFFDHRLPELFGGFSVQEFPFPVPYPTACSPQAWAAGTPFLILRSFLGLEPDLHHGVLYIDPKLPDGVSVELGGIELATGHLSLRVHGTDFECQEVPPGVEVIRGPRPEAGAVDAGG